MAIIDKGEQIFDSLLIDQYASSPNLKEFCMCYIAELDFLFQSIEESYYGRMLEHAEGAQQDVLGIILDESRNLTLPNAYFGFVGAAGATKMAAAATPNDGGIFKSASDIGFTVTPLSDSQFKRLLKAKAFILNSEVCGTEEMYSFITILLDKALSNLAVTFPASREVQLEISASEVTANEEELINYASKYFIGTGVKFTINRV